MPESNKMSKNKNCKILVKNFYKLPHFPKIYNKYFVRKFFWIVSKFQETFHAPLSSYSLSEYSSSPGKFGKFPRRVLHGESNLNAMKAILHSVFMSALIGGIRILVNA